MLRQIPGGNAVDVFCCVRTVCDSVILTVIRSCVGIEAVFRHFLCPDLCRLHELIACGKGGQATFPAQVVGQVYDLLADIFGVQGCFFRHFLLRRLAGIGYVTVHLNAVLPKDIEAIYQKCSFKKDDLMRQGDVEDKEFKKTKFLSTKYSLIALAVILILYVILKLNGY